MRASLAGFVQLGQALFPALGLYLAAGRVVQAANFDWSRSAGLGLANRRGTFSELQAVALLGTAIRGRLRKRKIKHAKPVAAVVAA